MLGFSVGLTLLYFSMITELRYVDEESGLYNRSYLAYLYDMALIGKKDVKSALILETDGDREAGFEVLRSSLHEKGDVIRAEAEKPSEVIYFVRSALERFAGGSPQSDDITMLCFKYLG